MVGSRRKTFLDRNADFEVVAVCDQNYRERTALPEHGGIPAYPNYEQLLENHDLDVLFVCLPNNIAAEVTIAGLERRMHVFCEKPPGRTVEDIRGVIAAEQSQSGVKLKYGFNHRYHDSVREAYRIIRSGELGRIINLRGVYGKSRIVPFHGNWRSERKFAGGGILLDQGIHMVDLMRLFCGEFVEVKSFVSNDYWNEDVEDNAYALMRDDQGRFAILHSTATEWEHHFSLHISLTEGYLKLHGLLTGSKSYGEEELTIGRRDEETATGSSRKETVKYLEDNSWRDEIAEFGDAIRGRGEIQSGSSADALATMQLVYRIYCADPAWKQRYDIAEPG